MAEQQTGPAFPVLQRFAQRATAAAAAAMERCELCSEPIPPQHRHLVDVSTREIKCVCQACSILFDQEASGKAKYRLIPNRRLYLEDFQLSDARWESLRIPVDMAFFFYSTPAERVGAFYPSPMGPTESLLELSAWEELEDQNPVLKRMQRDVEALLVNRARGAREYFLVPIDECYRLVGLIRIHWRGLSGGQEVWKEIGEFFVQLREHSRISGAER